MEYLALINMLTLQGTQRKVTMAKWFKSKARKHSKIVQMMYFFPSNMLQALEMFSLFLLCILISSSLLNVIQSVGKGPRLTQIFLAGLIILDLQDEQQLLIAALNPLPGF